MARSANKAAPPVLIKRQAGMLELILNRPQVLNTLNQEMVRALQKGINTARDDAGCRLVLLRGAGERGFCAGGDLKALVQLVRGKSWDRAMAFFQEEYALDLDIHHFPKPVVALTTGICLGGGLGLAAGADLVVATEDSRLAMPETGIGFFPDVGATGWLHAKCPPGYPEYLALTGQEAQGPEAVRLGLATHLVQAAGMPLLLKTLRQEAAALPAIKAEAVPRLRDLLAPWEESSIPSWPQLDAWVIRHFARKASVLDILLSLSQCRDHVDFDPEVLERLQARSPTALVLTLGLLRRNRGRPLEEVFTAEARAARFMISHPDYLEGIRARLLDRDRRPGWTPSSLQEVRLALDF